MVKQILVYWRDIPSQIIVQRGRRREKRLLSERFQSAVDRAAMRSGKGSSDLYLAEWRRETSRIDTDDAPGTIAERLAQKFESEYSDEKLSALIRNHGNEDS